MLLFLHIIWLILKKILLQNYKNYTARPETLGRAINRPHYLWKNLFALAIYRPRAKYSLKVLLMLYWITRFFYKQHFSKKHQVKNGIKQAKASWTFAIWNHFINSCYLSSKTNMRYSKKCAKNNCVCFNEIMWLLIVMKMKLKIKNGSHRYDINRTSPRRFHKYTKYNVSQYDDNHVH